MPSERDIWFGRLAVKMEKCSREDVQRGLKAVEALDGIQDTNLGEQLLTLGLIDQADYDQLEHILNKLPVDMYQQNQQVSEDDIVYGKVAILNRFCSKDDVHEAVGVIKQGKAVNMREALVSLKVLTPTEAASIDETLEKKKAADSKINDALKYAQEKTDRLEKIEKAVREFFPTPLHLQIASYFYEHPTTAFDEKDMASILGENRKKIREVLEQFRSVNLLGDARNSKYIMMPRGKSVARALEVLESSRDPKWRRKIIELVSKSDDKNRSDTLDEWTAARSKFKQSRK